MTKFLMVASIVLPAAAGVLLPVLGLENRKHKTLYVALVLVLEAIITTILILQPGVGITLFSMTPALTVSLYADSTSKLFMAIASYGFLLAGVFAFKYLENDDEECHGEEQGAFPENMFHMFYLLSLAALMGMDMSRNLIAMYFFFEMITLLSMPMVLHERTKESIAAAMKYLFYSIAGAFLALGAIFTLSRYSTTLEFVKGGSLDMLQVEGHGKLVLWMVFLGVVGFGAKGGMYPLHGWLPTAHPVAPAPASAVLSGIIAKAGVLAIIRLVYFTVGVQFLAGTWVQMAWLILSLLTVFMGSMMAYRETVFKKRLAYSSVSQISYALFGIFLMNPAGLTGGLMQILFHATVKICLFLVAGSFIHNKGYHHVEQLKGIGHEMPFTLACFTLASLSLIGIPPFAGFVSKWYLAEGALESMIPVLNWLGPVILLVSALLTAGYLLPVSVAGFFPGSEYRTKAEASGKAGCRSLKAEGGLLMVVPLVVLATLSLVLGMASGLLKPFFSAMVSSMI